MLAMHTSISPLQRVRNLPDWHAWQDLTRDAPPFLSPEFFTLAARFDVAPALVIEAWEGARLITALPLARHDDRLVGLRCEYTPSYDLCGTADGLDAIWKALTEDTTWRELELQKLPASSPLVSRLAALATRDGSPIAIRPDSRHPYLSIAGAFERLTPKFRTNLLRCERKAGAVELERIEVPDRATFDEALAIEAMAWKGAAGTSIDTDPRAENLYRVLAKLVGRRGRGALYFLRVQGRRIATLFSVHDGHTLFALKIGYDPAMSNLSPGHLLVRKVLLDAESRGLQELDFVGRDDEWKRKWTDRIREHVSLTVYRSGPAGVLRYAMRHVIRPHLPLALHGGLREILPRNCQRADLLGEHALTERAVDRVRRGFGIRSKLLRIGRPAKPAVREGAASAFAPGSWVRVKPVEAIRATLDARDRTRGLAFTAAQWETTDRVYRVSRSVRRLRDDRGTYRPVSRTVLLEGVDCAGSSADAAGCGRHCPMMYRDEWLEPAQAPVTNASPRADKSLQYARVRSADEIRAGLDAWGRRDGVTFMPEMSTYAGKRFAIAGTLAQVFELDRWLPTRAPCFLLAGLHCSGAIAGARGPCHRACSLIWHRDWLIIEPSVPARGGSPP